MRASRVLQVSAVVMFSLVPCFAHHMAVVVNKESTVSDVSAAHLAKMVLLEDRKWPGGKEVMLVLHKDSPGEAITLEHLSRMSGKDLKSFISSHQTTLTLVDTDDDVLRFVENTPGAIGFVDVRSINDQVRVLKVDGKLPMQEGYLPH